MLREPAGRRDEAAPPNPEEIMDTPNEVGRHCSIECRCGTAESQARREAAAFCECGPGCACGVCDCAK